ncbi:MAG: hypothetical protein HYY14_00585 [Candidatus Omnitrophica bacterium]|nr:hypothetical protein [Candidatus Omnitrophota bacterium]
MKPMRNFKIEKVKNPTRSGFHPDPLIHALIHNVVVLQNLLIQKGILTREEMAAHLDSDGAFSNMSERRRRR